mgnify:CR=1 FL=1
MGNANSSNQKGGDISEVQSKVEAFIQKLMNEKGDKIHNKQFCDHIQVVLKDNILSNLKKSELIDINSNYGIGFSVNDKQTKNEICSKLSEYYLKKIEVTLIIKNLLEMLSNKINNMSFMNRCVADKGKVSKIKYGRSKKWNQIPKHILDSINLSDIRTNMFEGTGIDPSSFYYVIELDNKEECEYNGGRWVSGLEALLKQGLIPPEDVKKYNNKYRALVNSINNKQALTINKLSNIFSKLCREEQQNVEKSKGKTERRNVYNELPISFADIIRLEDEVKKIIIEDIVGIEKSYLELVSLDIVTQKEIDEFNKEEERVNKLKDALKKQEADFQVSN